MLNVRLVFQYFYPTLLFACLGFSQYFSAKGFFCEHVHVQGSLHPITVHYLDTILAKTNFIQRLKDENDSYHSLISQFEDSLETEMNETEASMEAADKEVLSSDILVCRGCSKVFKENEFEDFVMHVALCSASGSEDSIELQPEDTLEQVGEVSEIRNTAVEKTSKNDLNVYDYSRKLRRFYNEKMSDFQLIIYILELIHQCNDDLSQITAGGSLLRFAGNKTIHDLSLSGKGAILVFLSGWADISNLIDNKSRTLF